MITSDIRDKATDLAERGWLPDAVIRRAIRTLASQRLEQERGARGSLAQPEAIRQFIARLRHEPVALVPQKANEQHYEVPPALFKLMLGPALKYSCCWWNPQTSTLGQAESHSLNLTIEHADLADGMRILELGCGWGSLSLEMARRYPASDIVAVSNSTRQREHIQGEAARLGLRNLRVHTVDMNTFDPGVQFDRIVSVEMFEHMRNYPALLSRVARWLSPTGRLFVHVFCHRTFAYVFDEHDDDGWMGRHFFSGGMMPSADLLPSVPSPLRLERRWHWDGTHYQRTADAWLGNLDRHRAEALAVLAQTYGAHEATRWFGRWRLFLLACSEVFGYAGGGEWGVAHYRFAPKARINGADA